jgi:hypothetical protein
MKRFAVIGVCSALFGCVGQHRDTAIEIRDRVRNIDVNPDQMHYDYTPAVFSLIELGRPAAIAVLPLLNDEDEFRRARAENVLFGVTAAEFGFRFGRGYPDRESEAKWRQLWVSMGDYSSSAPEEARLRSIAKWREWLSQNPNKSARARRAPLPFPAHDTAPLIPVNVAYH